MRYARQEKILGRKTHEKLRNASVAVVGVGGIGSNSALLCAQLGVKEIALVDRDVVELSNLGRQILFSSVEVGKPKALVAAKNLRALNPDVEVKAFNDQLSRDNAERFLSGADVVLDGTDNFETRAVMNEFCFKNKKPWIYAGALGFEAMLSTIVPGKTPCFACFASEPKCLLGCADAGILATTTAFIAAQQVQEAANLICFNKPKYAGRLFYVDLKNAVFNETTLKKKKNCRICRKICGKD